MGHSDQPAYGLWPLVIVNAAIFIMFAFSFAKPQSKTDWRSMGAFSAFILALFVEMYGFPLTIYLLSPWLQSVLPGTDLLTHDSGHLLYRLLGMGGNPHFNVLHILSNLLIMAGFFTVASAWSVLLKAQQGKRLAKEGIYSIVRHPQYAGFILVMLGFLLQWPTLLTLLMFPILVTMYVRLAKKEEAVVRAQFGAEYERYEAMTPAFFPRLFRSGGHKEARQI
jgi:protein-S-isoprenylcysteine O-methyltransferase Ste14